MSTLLSVKDLHFSYCGTQVCGTQVCGTQVCGTQVLKGIDLEVPLGSIVGYLGKNGAGKSTTIKLLLGLLPFEKGEIFFRGASLKDSPLALRSCTRSMIEHPFFILFLQFPKI